jgi:hypothetical protein
MATIWVPTEPSRLLAMSSSKLSLTGPECGSMPTQSAMALAGCLNYPPFASDRTRQALIYLNDWRAGMPGGSGWCRTGLRGEVMGVAVAASPR